MQRLARFDTARFRSHRLENGFLRADAQLTRPGVFPYLNADGSVRLEYRPPSEVFAARSLDSAKLIPVTNEHPPEMLTAQNTNTYRVGSAGENVAVKDDWIHNTVQVEDAAAIGLIESGKAELSCGYTVVIDPTPGVTPDGERYDVVQRDIIYNHVSIVDRGRVAGSRVLITDSATQITKEKGTMKVQINGDRFDVDQDVADAIKSLKDSHKAELDREKARADVAEAEAAKEKARADQAEDPARVDAAVKARLDLERAAAQFKIEGSDKMDNAEIMRAVILAECPEAKLDDASEVYLRARFDHVVQTASRSDVDETRKSVKESKSDQSFNEDAALNAIIQRSVNRYQQKEGE